MKELRVSVSANPTVTLDGLTQTVDADKPCFQFGSTATDAKLVLAGDNTVYARNGYPAVDIASGAKVTLSGTGALVGGKVANKSSRGVFNNGTLVIDGGTIRNYSCSDDGGAIYTNGGTVTMTGAPSRTARPSTVPRSVR